MVRELEDKLDSVTIERDDFRKHTKDGLTRQLNDQKYLAAALAACKLKDEALKLIALDDCCTDPAPIAQKALTIQPDASALKAWLGEPVAWLEGNPEGLWFVAYSKNDKAPQNPLYSPKGL
jgi:hypothetical protein